MSSDELKEENTKLQKENELLRSRLIDLELKLQEAKQNEHHLAKLKALPKIDDKTVLNVTVFGGGSFGTALAVVAARRGHNVIILVRDKEQCKSINEQHINPKRGWLQKYKLEPNIKCTTDIKEAVDPANTNIIIHSLPVQVTPDFLEQNAEHIPAHIPFVCTSKGIHLGTEKLLCDVIPSILHRTDPSQDRLLYLSGPSFAKEMMENHPVALTIASHNMEWSSYVQTALNSLFFRVYMSNDVVGVECGGALKNPLAIGAGIAVGLGYGQSTLAAIVTRGAVEIQRMAMELGCKNPNTLYGLSGFGDLMLTSMCELSRNRTCGYYIGKEKLSVEEAQKKVGETVEGVATAIVTQKLMKKFGIRMPLFDALADVLQDKLKPEEALKVVMAKTPDQEGFVMIQDLN
mmetsp:Transcript_20182/g.32056  ORF Transcript_20182/g.32056 Transcript_20182/m.32056 type:complete len:404 (+) Transcript_20182:28-1239(+)|eukprot:CAMPEP_0197028930 /NCGR_PEP_ID=MMETSP1384-20130603/8503_1 /TAXON_ID=29189 /ORGANISM="Ammonia sp." /LENGTH=403 /DNA_ID=CAMNT_0042458011 /DNA_START=28 /DNA_END=1239 /DNA_ORIENTATION=-